MNKPECVIAGNARVKIYARDKGGYTVYEVADYSTGARRLRSFSDHDEAVKEAKRIAKLLAGGDAVAASMTSSERASFGRALELLKPTGVALELAAAHFAEAFKLLGGDRVLEAAKFFVERNPDQLPQRTVSEVVEELIAAKTARGKSVRYLQDLRARLNRFAADFQVPISGVTTGDVQLWLDGVGGSAQTIKNFRTVLHTLFAFAEARGYIFRGTNPVKATERISARNGDVTIYTSAELKKLLAGAPADFKLCIALGAFAGLRSAEIERLTWSDVNLAKRFITVAAEKAKTASRRLVPIAANLLEWLKPHAKASGHRAGSRELRQRRV